MPVSFHSQIKFVLKHKVELKSWIDAAIRKEKGKAGRIHFVFCSDEALYQINLKYLQHSTFTDIITFDYSENGLVSGDAFISIDRVKENAKEFGISFDRELHRVMIHGVLHLLGYNDKDSSKKKEMTQKENFYLATLKI